MFAELLLEALDRKQWLPRQLAESCGVDMRQLSGWLAGQREDLTPDILFRLAMALEIDLATLSRAAGVAAAGERAGPVVVGISGASCAGKSWLAERIQAQQDNRSIVVDLDGYYRAIDEVSGLEHGYDNPASIDADRALADLTRLKSGQAVNLPVYNYEEQRVTGFRSCEPRPLILVEGLFVFAYPALRQAFDLKVWVESSDDLRWSRRVDRDSSCRQLQVEEIITRYERDVVPGYRKFIEPLRQHADLIVCNNGFDAAIVPAVARLLGGLLQRG